MKRRNPPARKRSLSGPFRTPGQMLFDMAMTHTSPDQALRLKLLTRAASTLAMEARAGLWSDRD